MRILLAILAACGTASAPATPSGPPASPVSTAATPDDVVVASVDGRPVWGSCVAAQARRGAARDQALRQCIDFELMARAAERRGLAIDADVVDATRTALVSRLVAHTFEDGFDKPSDFGDLWGRLVEKYRYRVSHEEYRASAYVRAPVADGAPPEAEARAHALADQIAAAAAPETGMLGSHLFDLAHRVAGAAKLDEADTPPFRLGGLEEHYAAALFAIPAIGRASPAVRTKWGWDVIVWTDDVPAHEATSDELARALLPDVKRTYFTVWVGRLVHDLGIRVEVSPDAAAKLEALP